MEERVDDQHERIRGELVRRDLAATRTITRGLVLIALVPVVLALAVVVAAWFGAQAAAIGILLGALYTLLGSIGGLALLASGGVEKREARKALRELDAQRQLPAARVVVR